MIKDITSPFKQELGFTLQVISSDTTTTGAIIDVSDATMGVSYTLFSGAWTDGTYTPILFESDDSGMSGATAVADVDLLGQDPASSVAPETQAVLDADDEIKKLGYRGSKRYIRLSIVSTATTTGSTIGAVVSKSVDVKPAAVV